MKDVARVAGVHHTTVSMALRNDPRLPTDTRARIRQCAADLGYRPDPMLSALSSYRMAIRPLKAPPTIAFVTNMDATEFKIGNAHPQFLAGVQEGAASLGYKVDRFTVGTGESEIRSLQRILWNRAIRGVIIAMIDKGPEPALQSWDSFSIVTIESRHLGLKCHNVGNNQELATRDAIRHLCQLGYRRIGLVVGEEEEGRLGGAFSAGYCIEKARSPNLLEISPFFLSSPAEPALAEFRQWLLGNRVDVVLSTWESVPALIRSVGVRIPEDVALVSLDLSPNGLVGSGIVQNHRLVGRRAVEQLDMLMRTNAHAFLEYPNNILIQASWTRCFATSGMRTRS